MMAIMCCPLIEGYGSTESTAGVMYSNTLDPQHGQFAELTTTAEIRLCDIPEMRYTSGDTNELGESSPRGELWIRGPQVFLGYYKQPDMTKETITPDGWLKTGDVAQLMPRSNAIKIIDRKKNIFKLQQGEYIAPDKVENVYSKQGLVTSEVFLHGESSKDHTVLVASPHKEHFLSFLKAKGLNGSYEELCSSRQARELVLKELNAFAKKEGLNSLEQAKNIYFEPEGFVGKDILTNTMKLIRFEAKKHYKAQIEAMYAEGDIVSAKK
jgi:long-chain acyl-CoA synthetase